MANWEFYDKEDEVEDEDVEPSFSIYDFKKWLVTQEEPTFKEEVLEEDDKDLLKEEFKKRVKDRVQKKINKRLKKDPN